MRHRQGGGMGRTIAEQRPSREPAAPQDIRVPGVRADHVEPGWN